MSAEPVRIPTPNDPSSLPVWDRLTAWASKNKAVVYTVAGVAVVVSGAGVAYYLSGPRSDSAAAAEKKRLSKKERRKAKQDKEKEKGETVPDQPQDCTYMQRNLPVRETEVLLAQSRAPTVKADPLEGIPQIDESTVETLSEEVRERSIEMIQRVY